MYHTRARMLTASLLLFLIAIHPAAAGPYDDGLAAYKKGDWATAYKVLKPIAETDTSQSAVAQQRLGLLTEHGRGTAKDPAQAAKWYQKAADQGDTVAQGHLGRLYRLGAGVPRDATQAAKWSIKAATQGNAAAQANLGYMSLEGFGLPADAAAAGGWFKRAAEQGDASAEFGLATLYEAGRGVPKDVVKKIQTDVAKVLQLPDVREKLLAIGADPVGSTPDYLLAHMHAEYDRYGPIIRKLGIKAE